MAKLVEFLTDTGGSIIIEVSDATSPAVRRVVDPSKTVEIASTSLEKAIEKVSGLTSLVEKLRSLAKEAEEIEIEFGIKLSAEAGAIIASTATEANFSVRLAWKNSGKQTAPDGKPMSS